MFFFIEDSPPHRFWTGNIFFLYNLFLQVQWGKEAKTKLKTKFVEFKKFSVSFLKSIILSVFYFFQPFDRMLEIIYKSNNQFVLLIVCGIWGISIRDNFKCWKKDFKNLPINFDFQFNFSLLKWWKNFSPKLKIMKKKGSCIMKFFSVSKHPKVNISKF